MTTGTDGARVRRAAGTPRADHCSRATPYPPSDQMEFRNPSSIRAQILMVILTRNHSQDLTSSSSCDISPGALQVSGSQIRVKPCLRAIQVVKPNPINNDYERC